MSTQIQQMPKNLNVTRAEKMHKPENCRDGANVATNPRRKKHELTIPVKKLANNLYPSHPLSQKKIKSPHLRLGEMVDARHTKFKIPQTNMKKTSSLNAMISQRKTGNDVGT